MDLFLKYGINASTAPSFGTYQLLYEETVTSAKTQIDITGLNITKDDEVRLVYTLVGSNTNNHTHSLYPNDLTTASNYYNERLLGTGGTLFAQRQNNNIIANSRSNVKTNGFADIKISNNDRFVVQSQSTESIGSNSSAIENNNHNVVGTQTVTSITKLSLVCSITNGIAPGSKIQLFKVN